MRYSYNLVAYLVGSKEYISIVLSEATYAEKSVKRARKLVAMYSAEFTVAKRQFLV